MGNCAGDNRSATLSKRRSRRQSEYIDDSQNCKEKGEDLKNGFVVEPINIIEPSELPSEEVLHMIQSDPQQIFMRFDVDNLFNKDTQNCEGKSTKNSDVSSPTTSRSRGLSASSSTKTV